MGVAGFWLLCSLGIRFGYFLEEMGIRPSREHSVERVDVNGNYEPGNCRWGTDEEQRRNKRHSIYVEWRGGRVFLKDLCVTFGVPYQTVMTRVRKGGWDIERAVATPVNVWGRYEARACVARKGCDIGENMRKTEHITVPMTSEMLGRVRAAAALEGRPVSNWARLVFERALDASEGGVGLPGEHYVEVR